MTTVNEMIEKLWQDYVAINPQAQKIHSLLAQRGETIVNDHIALRTYDDPRVGLGVVSAAFTKLGYRPGGEYHFPEKKLFARHFDHPDGKSPKVFVSELKLAECSEGLRKIVKSLVDQVPGGFAQRWDLPVSGRPWKVSYSDYEMLRAESEYAAWMAAFGFRANHFTVQLNSLKTFKSIQDFNTFVKTSGFPMNTSGGEVKGSPEALLEQSSTLAAHVDVDFTDGRHKIPSCYYEFAKRYPLPNGKLFGGFVEKSADKIFESTNKR